MEQKEIIEGNMAIAEFMGIKVFDWKPRNHDRLIMANSCGDFDYEDIEDYNPDVDWNKLIPVVEKIEGYDNFKVSIFRRCCDIEEIGNDRYFPSDPMVEVTGKGTKIHAVWLAVIEFIKWYNQTHP